MKKLTNIIRWIGVSVFGIMAIASLASGGVFGALLFVLGGALIAPVSVITQLRSKLKLNKSLSIVLAVILLFGGTFAMPTSEVPDDTSTDTNISETVSKDTSKDEADDDKADKKTDASSTKDTTSETEDNSSKDNTSKDDSAKDETDPAKDGNDKKTDKTQTTTCSHTDTTTKDKVNATCTENGYSGDTYCNSCNKVIKNGSQIGATGHNSEVRNQKSATTTSEGYTGDTYCKTCGVKLASGETIPKVVDNTQQDNKSQTVYTTATGKKYHSTKNCSGLSNANAIYDSTLEDAENQGLTPCSKCH